MFVCVTLCAKKWRGGWSEREQKDPAVRIVMRLNKNCLTEKHRNSHAWEMILEWPLVYSKYFGPNRKHCCSHEKASVLVYARQD